MSNEKKLTVEDIKNIIREAAKEYDEQFVKARKDFEDGSEEFDFEVENDPMPVDIPDGIMVSYTNSQ